MDEAELQRRVAAVWGNMAASTNHQVPRAWVEAALRELHHVPKPEDEAHAGGDRPPEGERDGTG